MKFLALETVTNAQSLCLAIICRKQSPLDIPFDLIVVSIFLKTCPKDDRDSSRQLLEERFD